MKTFCVIFLLVLSAGATEAQVTRDLKKIDSLSVPTIIIQKFYKLASNSRDVSWTHEHITQVGGPISVLDLYRSEFHQEGDPGGATFDGTGLLMDFQVYAKLDTLPRAVRRTIEKRLNEVRRSYPEAIPEICVLGSAEEEGTTVSYSVEFYKSASAKVNLERIGEYEIDVTNKGRVIKRRTRTCFR